VLNDIQDVIYILEFKHSMNNPQQIILSLYVKYRSKTPKTYMTTNYHNVPNWTCIMLLA